MDYKVTQKIKAFGLEKGDIFERIGTSALYARTYKNGSTIIVPEFILQSHPEWFFPQVARKQMNVLVRIAHERKKERLGKSLGTLFSVVKKIKEEL